MLFPAGHKWVWSSCNSLASAARRGRACGKRCRLHASACASFVLDDTDPFSHFLSFRSETRKNNDMPVSLPRLQ